SEHVDRATDIGTTIVNVARDLLHGRPQPGAVEIPVDLQYAEVADLVVAAPAGGRGGAAPKAVHDGGRPIARKSRGVGMAGAGGGVLSSGAAAEVQQLAEALDAPVFTTGNGRGAIPEDHRLAMGPLTAQGAFADTLRNAEVVIAIGTRFQPGATTNWQLKLGG